MVLGILDSRQDFNIHRRNCKDVYKVYENQFNECLSIKFLDREKPFFERCYLNISVFNVNEDGTR